MQMITGLIKF